MQSFVGILSLWTLCRALGAGAWVPDSIVSPLSSTLERWRIASPYGLFAVMTPERPEIVIEGSADGVAWRAYEFTYKPGDPSRSPPFVPFLHMPRLDWQMWFEALGRFEKDSWFARFLQALLEGRKPVLGLLAKNPFPDSPPAYVRARYYRYHMSPWGSPTWWVREELGNFSPVLQLRRQ